MIKNEIAQNLTLKALEMKSIFLDNYPHTDKAKMAEANAFNAKQISVLYICSIYEIDSVLLSGSFAVITS